MSHLKVYRSWNDVLFTLDRANQDMALRIPLRQLPHPADEGARESIGMPEGQKGDYRFKLPDCRCLHVKVFDDHYEAHVDQVDPSHNWLEHLRADLPGGYVAASGGTGAAIGAIVGLVVGKKKEAMLVGGLVGALLGLLSGTATLPENSDKKPKTV